MASGDQPARLGDARPERARWADLVDTPEPRDETYGIPPMMDESYDAPAPEVEAGLHSRLAQTNLKSGPIDFTFLTTGILPPSAGVSASPSSVHLADSASGASLGSAFAPPASWTASDSARALEQEEIELASTSTQAAFLVSSAAAAKSRRSRGKRALSTGQEADVQRLAAKRTREFFPNAGPPEASEEEWQHRIAKRRKQVTNQKASAEYQLYVTLRPIADRLAREPRTPVADDRSQSKRNWEYLVQKWRTDLKQWAAAHAYQGCSSAASLLISQIDEA